MNLKNCFSAFFEKKDQPGKNANNGQNPLSENKKMKQPEVGSNGLAL